MPIDLDEIFKAYDIRGTYPDQLDEDLCRRVGNAFVRFVETSPIVVARDMRTSSEPLSEAFIDGAVMTGAEVISIGLASTDMAYFASGHLDAPAAMFTASHNPAKYNGIKMCRAGAAPIGLETGLQAIKAFVADGMLVKGEEPGRVQHAELLDDFAKHVHSFVDVSALKPLRVVADTANGMGGLVVPAVFRDLPFDLHVLYPELDGTFPNHPADPIQPENLKDLQKAVLETGADIGLAFDGDADRVFLVDNEAEPVSGSVVTAMIAESILRRYPGSPVVHNVICSKIVPETINANDGIPIRTRVGHSFIKQIMAENGAIFGGEHSGHYYFRDNWFADSGLIAAMLVLEMVSQRGALSEIRKPFEKYSASGEINSTVDDPLNVIEIVATEFDDAPKDRLDGLTVDLGDWWFNLRPSNTEPLLRLNVEAANPQLCEAGVAQVLDLIRDGTN